MCRNKVHIEFFKSPKHSRDIRSKFVAILRCSLESRICTRIRHLFCDYMHIIARTFNLLITRNRKNLEIMASVSETY